MATGQRRDRSLPRPTWLPDGRSWVNSSSMSELGIVLACYVSLKHAFDVLVDQRLKKSLDLSKK
jgi:hypothetical protein